MHLFLNKYPKIANIVYTIDTKILPADTFCRKVKNNIGQTQGHLNYFVAQKGRQYIFAAFRPHIFSLINL